MHKILLSLAPWRTRVKKVGAALGVACLGLLCNLPAHATTVDLPACEATAPGMAQGLSLGMVQPHASEHVLAYAGRLTLADPSLSICAESWSSLLPRWVPWAGALERGQGFVLFALAFVLTVAALWRLTPRHWWRRTTLVGLLAVGAGTWLLGLVLMAAFHAAGGQRLLYGTVVSLRLPQQAQPQWLDVAGARELEALLAQAGALPKPAAALPATAAAPPSPPPPPAAAAPADAPPAPVAQPLPAGPYRVAHRLNLRTGPGVQHAHLITLPRGDEVQFDGAVQGDWWRIRSRAGQVGWSSSLWLRRPDEGLPPPAAMPNPAPRS